MRLPPWFTTLLLLIPALAALAEPGYPVTVKDATGFPVTLTAKPQAVVSLTLATDELLFELIDHHRLKAIDVFAADPGISNIADFAKAFPRKLTGEKEKILELQPDLVFLASWKEPEFVQALRDAHVPVFVFRSPNDFEQLKTAVTQVATLVGEPLRGQALWARVEQRLAAVAEKVKTVPADRRPSVLSYSFYGGTYGRGTSFDTLAEKAGVVNAAARAGMTAWPRLSKEEILAMDPEIITMPSWSYDGKSDPNHFLSEFLNDPVFAGLQAVKNKRVVILPDKHMVAASQYMVDGVEDLARAAYPALFR